MGEGIWRKRHDIHEKGEVTHMSMEYVLEEHGYEMSDNIVRRCMMKLRKVFAKRRTHVEYVLMTRKVLNKAA